MGSSLLQLPPEEEIEGRSCLAAIETEEMKKEIEKKKMNYKKKKKN